MTRRHFAGAAGCVTGFVVASRWPWRSHALFSWDSANYALAMARIDIAAHRPHPPGYLGYVFAGRAINLFVHDPNMALVLWNMFAAAIAAAILLAFVSPGTAESAQTWRVSAATTAVLLTSPLLWFYSEVAEIYTSEMLVAALAVWCASLAASDPRRSIWCGAAIACAVLFKASAAALVLPAVGYFWFALPPADRRAALQWIFSGFAVAVAILLALQPHLPSIVWTQFVTTTAGSRVIGGGTNVATTLNRNVRDTLTAIISMLGLVNVGGIIAWMCFDRRLPAALNSRLASLWAAPWLLMFLLIHIAKPGYVLPLLPVFALIIGNYYGRQRPAILWTVLALQATANAAQFAFLAPFPPGVTGGTKPYREKTAIERAASDLQALTFPTAATIRRSDAAVSALTAVVAHECGSGDPAIVAGGGDPVDWRRVMWYFPAARVIRQEGRDFSAVAVQREALPISANGVVFMTPCPIVWVALENSRPPGAVPVSGVGWLSAGGTIRVTPHAITR